MMVSQNWQRIQGLLLLLATLLFYCTEALAPQQSTQALEKTPVVICPGFGNDKIDYYEPLQQPRDVGLVACLERRGFDPNLIFCLPVERKDWFRVAGGLLDLNFYTNQALPTGGGYGWYLQRFKDTVDMAHEAANTDDAINNNRVLVLGHSAGGWLARAGMGNGVWCEETQSKTADKICGLVTVGAIHKPPVSVGSCVTRGALAYTDQNYRGAFLKEDGIGYVSVGGDAIVGDETKKDEPQPTDADSFYATRGEGSAARVAFTSYKAVCGQGDVTGDGVVPLEWTQLEGSKQLKLEGVLHSINEAGTTIPTNRWYGSEAVIDRWLPTALEEAGIKTNEAGIKKNAFDIGTLQKWASDIFQPQ